MSRVAGRRSGGRRRKVACLAQRRPMRPCEGPRPVRVRSEQEGLQALARADRGQGEGPRPAQLRRHEKRQRAADVVHEARAPVGAEVPAREQPALARVGEAAVAQLVHRAPGHPCRAARLRVPRQKERAAAANRGACDQVKLLGERGARAPLELFDHDHQVEAADAASVETEDVDRSVSCLLSDRRRRWLCESWQLSRLPLCVEEEERPADRRGQSAALAGGRRAPRLSHAAPQQSHPHGTDLQAAAAHPPSTTFDHQARTDSALPPCALPCPQFANVSKRQDQRHVLLCVLVVCAGRHLRRLQRVVRTVSLRTVASCNSKEHVACLLLSTRVWLSFY